MSISPAQVNMGSSSTRIGDKPIAAPPAESSSTKGSKPPVHPGASGPLDPSGTQYSLSLRMDDQKRAYYAVISEHTGEVVYQIPPEQVRQVAEGIAEFLKAGKPPKGLDVKS